MQVSDTQLKIIAIGLVPIFLVFSSVLPQSAYKNILLGIIVLIGVAVVLIGVSREKKQEAKEREELLALPPKK